MRTCLVPFIISYHITHRRVVPTRLMLAFLLAEARQGEQNHRHSSNSTRPCSAAGGATQPAK